MQGMLEELSGATRLHLIIGDPIAQVKSPAGVTRALQAKGRNAVLVPIRIPAADLDAFMAGVSLARNVDGIIVTVPHKLAAVAHCATVSERARFLQAVNVMRRAPDGRWHGDMFDGLAFVAALGDARMRATGQAGAPGRGWRRRLGPSPMPCCSRASARSRSTTAMSSVATR